MPRRVTPLRGPVVALAGQILLERGERRCRRTAQAGRQVLSIGREQALTQELQRQLVYQGRRAVGRPGHPCGAPQLTALDVLHLGDELDVGADLQRRPGHHVAASQAAADLPRVGRTQRVGGAPAHPPPAGEDGHRIDLPELPDPLEVVREQVDDPLVPQRRIGACGSERQDGDARHQSGGGRRTPTAQSRDPRQCDGDPHQRHGRDGGGGKYGRASRDPPTRLRSPTTGGIGGAPATGECLAEGRGRAEAVGRDARERGNDRLLQMRRHRVANVTDLGCRLAHPPGEGCLGRRRGKGRLARQHLVQHAAESVDVAPRVDRRLTQGLLGRHVGGRADGEPGRRQLRGRGTAHGAGDAEVGHHGVAALQQDVLRLDIAVNEPVVVRMGERIGHLARDAERLVHRAAAAPAATGRGATRPRYTASRSRAGRRFHPNRRAARCWGAAVPPQSGSPAGTARGRAPPPARAEVPSPPLPARAAGPPPGRPPPSRPLPARAAPDSAAPTPTEPARGTSSSRGWPREASPPKRDRSGGLLGHERERYRGMPNAAMQRV